MPSTSRFSSHASIGAKCPPIERQKSWIPTAMAIQRRDCVNSTVRSAMLWRWQVLVRCSKLTTPERSSAPAAAPSTISGCRHRRDRRAVRDAVLVGRAVLQGRAGGDPRRLGRVLRHPPSPQLRSRRADVGRRNERSRRRRCAVGRRRIRGEPRRDPAHVRDGARRWRGAGGAGRRRLDSDPGAAGLRRPRTGHRGADRCAHRLARRGAGRALGIVVDDATSRRRWSTSAR